MHFMEEALDWPLARLLPVMQKRIMEECRYHGIPTLKNPLDFWVYQEIVWETRPDVIVEIGNLYGGSTLALAHMCDALGGGRVVGVDSHHAEIHPSVRAHPRIGLITGDACEAAPQVKRELVSARSVLIIDDSLHSYDHTLNVLQVYSEFVTVGNYFIVEDGICHHGLDIGPQPGPYEAVESFIRANANFMIDRNKESFGITWNPKGYLKRIS